MESIIETLYINLPRPQVPDDLELEKAKEEYLQMSDLIAKQYGLDFIDRFANLREQIDSQSREREFSLGFRTCARLMLEALEG